MKKMKKALALLLGLVMTVSTAAVPSFATESGNATVAVNHAEDINTVAEVFKDIDAGAWYVDAVQYVYDHDVMSGSNNLFEPGKAVTRAMVVTTLYRMAGSPEVTDSSACEELLDVKEGQWYTDAVCWAYEHEIASGNSQTKKFNASTAVTREQLATFLYKYAQYAGFATDQKGDLTALLNADKMGSYAEEAVVWAVGAGLISGVKKTDEAGNVSYDLAPKAGATRAQLASILMRFCEEYCVFEETPNTIPGEMTGTTTEATGEYSTTPRYFPVTMYNYDGNAMNAITRRLEIEKNLDDLSALGEWRGLYFTDGDQESANFDYSEYMNQNVAYEKVTGNSLEVGASYVLVSNFTDGSTKKNYGVGAYQSDVDRFAPTALVDVSKGTLTPTEVEGAIVWTYDESMRLYCEEEGVKKYINILDHASNHNTAHGVELTTTASTGAVVKTTSTEGVFLVHDTDACSNAGCYLNQVDNTASDVTKRYFGGWDGTDGGSQFLLYKRVETPDLDNPGIGILHRYTQVTDSTTNPDASYLLVSNYAESSTNYYYALGKQILDGDGNPTGYMTGTQRVTGTINETALNDNTLVWKIDADGYVYYVEDGTNYYLNIADSCADSASHTGAHQVYVTTEKTGAAKIRTTSDANTTETAGIFYIYDEDAQPMTAGTVGNLAQGKTATASSIANNCGPELAVDGNQAAPQWNSVDMKSGQVSDDTEQTHQWLQVDLEKSGYQIEQIKLWYNLKVWPMVYRIETTDTPDDADSWQTVVSVSRPSSNGWVENGEGQDIADTGANTDTITTSSNPSLQMTTIKRYVRFYVEKVNAVAGGNNVNLREIEIFGSELGIQDTENGTYLNLLDKTGTIRFGGWTSGDKGSQFRLYKQEAITETGNMNMADYNLWTGFPAWNPESIDNPLGGMYSGTLTGDPGDYQNRGNRLYGDMVKDTLDAEGNIQFNITEPGVFTLEETDYKQVYTNVDMPFNYDYTTGLYSFNSAEMSARFTGGQGADNAVLKYTGKQEADKTYGDGSDTMWMPFNDVDSLAGVTKDYHFGMVFNIPFFMTANGILPGTNPDNEQNHIVFDFSGDDDVWVFIDGQLVLDMGGIHNNLRGQVDFATNTWKVSRDPNTNDKTQPLSYMDGAPTTGNLFATAANTNDGLLSMTREAFAETAVHTLTVFYMERGAGSSNNKISFNLPVRDSVNVLKEINTHDENGNELSQGMLDFVNNRDFKFKLTNNGTPEADRNYYLMDVRGMYLQTLQTNANGEFTLKNGQTAKFVGQIIPGSNYVVEEIENIATTAWLEPDWYSIARLTNPVTTTTNDVTVTDPKVATTEETTTASWTCNTVEVPVVTEPLTDAGSSYQNYMEMINIRCTNTLDLDGEPEINDDRIVIDYGLPVDIDIFANDIVPDNVTLDYENIALESKNLDSAAPGKGEFGTAVYDSTTKKVTYTLTKQLTAAEKFEYTVPYSDGEGNTGVEEATIWIMPATSMYYEEDFGFVTYTGAWTDKEEGERNDYQEPGVVSTVGDSPYGSDVAYLDDGADSNGTCKYVQTTASEGAGFTYTFTGTGTTFFARTTNNSGYMKVDIECLNSDSTTTYVDQWRRDTSYKTDDDNTTLYNIPVFSWMAEEYGTYKVTVSLAKLVTSPKTGEQLYGTEFWLDGIKVFEPSDPGAADAAAVDSAYANDGEANVDVVTLRNKIIHNQMVYDEATQSYTWSEQDEAAGRFVVFTDFKKTEDGEGYDAGSQQIVLAEDYISRGPKEEVYLESGQSVSFALKEWDPNGAHVFLGIKAPMGAGTVLINGSELSINNSVDGYYEISDYRDLVNGNAKFVIAAGEDSLISLTTIKVTGGTEFTIISDLDQEIDNVALSSKGTTAKVMVNKVSSNYAYEYIPGEFGGNTDNSVQINKINDGTVNTNNYFDFGNDNLRKSIYLELDLKDQVDISTIELYRYWQDGRTYDATVIAVSDNEEFTNPTIVYNSDTNNVHGLGVGTSEKYPESSSGKVVDVNTTARYVRVYNYGSSAGNTNHVVEIKVLKADGTNVALATAGTTAKAMVNVPVADEYAYVASQYGGNQNSQIGVINDGVKDNYNSHYDFGRDQLRQSFYIELDLQQIYRLTEIDLYRYWNDGRTYGPTVIAVSDNADFSEPYIVYNSDTENVHGLGAGRDAVYPETSEGKAFSLPWGTTGRYVRIYTYGRPDPNNANKNFNTNHIVEIEVYAVKDVGTSGDASDAAKNIDIDVTGYEGGDALPATSSEV